MWTSYRYCIGRHTYVTSLASEMAQHYYNKLENDRKEFTATDIRKEIMDKLRFLPFSFNISRWYDVDPYNPIEVFMNFLDRYNVETYDDLITYNRVEYDVNHDEFTFEKKTPTIKSYFSVSDIDELLPWENLAACFDVKNHKMVTIEYDGKTETLECFKSWVRKTVPIEDKPGYCKVTDFGWKQVWIDVNEYVKMGDGHHYLNSDYVTKVEDM